MYLKGKTGSGTLDLTLSDGVGWSCQACAYNTSRWTRCELDNITTSATGALIIGNNSNVCLVSRPAQSVYMAMGQCEAGAGPASSPIDSTGLPPAGQLWRRLPDQVENQGVQRTATLGDSLTANLSAQSATTLVYPRWPERYATLSGRTVDNWAINGAGLTGPSNVQLQYSDWAARSAPQRLAILVGINEILNGSDGHTLWTAYQTWIESLSPMPATLILMNLLPFGAYSGWTAGKETQLTNFNADMATYCAAHPAILCIDTHQAMWDPGDHTMLNPSYAAVDGLHLSQAGANALGDAVFAGAP